MYIDVHCHVDLLEELNEVLNRARKKRVRAIVTNGVDPKSNKKILEISEKIEEVKLSVGMYPIDGLKLSKKEIDDEIKLIRKLKNKVSAIGEIGLDLKHDSREMGFDRQKKIFSKFVKLAIELRKPVIVHSRKAERETIEILEGLNIKKVDMHCFSGKLKLVDRIVGNGWFLSIPTCVKYSEHFQKVIERTPVENLLCETDSPYLHPDREFPNEPVNVIESYKAIAKIKKMKLKEVENEIEKNFKRLFDE